MESHPQKTLEELIHRELSKLPEQAAPETLVPRVLARIQARQQRHWWQRPWPQWPWAAQIASLPLMLGGVVSAFFGLSVIWKFMLGYNEFGSISDTVDWVAGVWDFLGVLGNAGMVLGRSVGQEWLLLALLVPVLMYLACVGLGTLCYRMAVSQRSIS
jgi:hypothetical protein